MPDQDNGSPAGDGGRRKTYRLSEAQFSRLKKLRAELSAQAGHRVSWQLVMSTVLEAGLRYMDPPTPSAAGEEN